MHFISRSWLLPALAVVCYSSAIADGVDRLWQATVDGFITTMTAGGGQVFVAGTTAEDQFLVGAYDAGRGNLVWRDVVEREGRANQALAIARAGGRVFAVGSANYDSSDGSSTFLVRTYDMGGRLAWESEIEDGDQRCN